MDRINGGGFITVLTHRLIHEGVVCTLRIPDEHRNSFACGVYEACNNQKAVVLYLYKEKESGNVFINVRVLAGELSGAVLEKVKSNFLEFGP